MRLRLRLRSSVVLVLGMVLAATISCTEQPDRYTYLRITVDGQQTLGITKKDVMIRGVVLFFHGMDDNEFTLTSDEAHQSITEKLVNAGFALVSSVAGGNSFGTAVSQKHYLELGGMALQYYHMQNIFVLAEEMGAISAMNLFATMASLRVRGVAAINPVMNLATVPPQYAPVVAENFPDQPTADAADPMKLPPDAFRDRKIRFYVSPDDHRVPADTNAIEFQARFGADADISIVQCSGAHDDPSCFQGDDLVKWFTQLEQRAS